MFIILRTYYQNISEYYIVYTVHCTSSVFKFVLGAFVALVTIWGDQNEIEEQYEIGRIIESLVFLLYAWLVAWSVKSNSPRWRRVAVHAMRSNAWQWALRLGSLETLRHGTCLFKTWFVGFLQIVLGCSRSCRYLFEHFMRLGFREFAGSWFPCSSPHCSIPIEWDQCHVGKRSFWRTTKEVNVKHDKNIVLFCSRNYKNCERCHRLWTHRLTHQLTPK